MIPILYDINLKTVETLIVLKIDFSSNPPSTVNTAKFDCLDLSGPPCNGVTV